MEEKRRTGDWEGDLVVGRNHRGCLLTLVDRAAKKTKIRLLASKEAGGVADAMEEALRGEVVRTVTLDNGKEFSAHGKFSAATGRGSTSPTLTVLGNAASTKIPTALSGSIFRRGRIFGVGGPGRPGG